MISVCIATYNGEKYIKEQLNSIIPQLSDDDEIIVSDDGSTDSTLEIVKSVNRDIKILHHKKRNERFILDYSTHNFEFALKQANGEYIFLCDQDDVWLPGKVEKMVADLKRGNLVSICDCKVCTDNLDVYQESFFKENGTKLNMYSLITCFRMLGCCMAVRRELLDIAFPFPKTKVGHDIWLVLLAQYFGKAHMIVEPLHLYRRHTDTVTCAGRKSKYPVWFRIYLRLFIIKAFTKRVIKLHLRYRKVK